MMKKTTQSDWNRKHRSTVGKTCFVHSNRNAVRYYRAAHLCRECYDLEVRQLRIIYASRNRTVIQKPVQEEDSFDQRLKMGESLKHLEALLKNK